MVSGDATWPEVVLLALNVFQVVALAWISGRSNRVRASDRRGDHEKPEQDL